MRSFSISHKKDFMSAVLLHDDFDDFTLSEATVKTAVSFVIDGKINADFFSSEDPAPAEPFVRYGEVRNFFFEIIKGKRTPVYFKFVFHAPRALTEKILASADSGFSIQDINSLSLTATFKDGALSVISGTNLATFSLDKSVDEAWDKYVERIISKFE